VGLTFYIDDGVIEITTTEIADNAMYTVVYPVQDLLVEPPPFIEPPQFDLSYASSRGSAGGGSGGVVIEGCMTPPRFLVNWNCVYEGGGESR
jgi:hypothetical protein